MITNYIALARKNREKALTGLKRNRSQILSMSDYAVHPKAPRRTPDAIFMSSRNVGAFMPTNLH